MAALMHICDPSTVCDGRMSVADIREPFRAALVCTSTERGRIASCVTDLGMKVSLDGSVAASGGDLGRTVSSDELFQWWSDRSPGTPIWSPFGSRLNAV